MPGGGFYLGGGLASDRNAAAAKGFARIAAAAIKANGMRDQGRTAIEGRIELYNYV